MAGLEEDIQSKLKEYLPDNPGWNDITISYTNGKILTLKGSPNKEDIITLAENLWKKHHNINDGKYQFDDIIPVIFSP